MNGDPDLAPTIATAGTNIRRSSPNHTIHSIAPFTALFLDVLDDEYECLDDIDHLPVSLTFFISLHRSPG